MSFIYDDDSLVLELFRSALADQIKTAQLAPNVNVNMEYKNYLNLSNKLVDDLQQSYFPKAKNPNAPAEVAAAGEANMGVPDMNSFGNFLEFIAKNQITVNGQRVAYFVSENSPSLDKKLWLPVNAERSTVVEVQNSETGARDALRTDYYVNKTLLSTYMQHLAGMTSKEDPESQKIIKALLGGLVDKVNSAFGTKLTTDYVVDKSSAYSPDDVLTTFPQTLDAKLYNADGAIPLTWGDIASPAAVKNWVNTNSILVKAGPEGKAVGVNDPEFDFCTVAKTLYGKATWLQRTKATTPELEKKYDAFSKKVVEVSAGLQGPDGKACSLASGQTNPQAGPGQGQGEGGAAGTLSNATLNNIAANLPFAIRDIDFNRIDAFFKAVSSLLGNNTQAVSHMTEVQGLMNQFSTQYTGHSDRVVPLSININQFANMMKDQVTPGKQVYPALNLLNRIIDSTRAVVDLFYSQYEPQIKGTLRAYVLGQIGRNSDDSSIYRRNSEDLENLRRSGTPTSK